MPFCFDLKGCFNVYCVKKCIYKSISDLLELREKINSPMFYTGLEVNINLDLENAEFDIPSLRDQLHLIGDILIRLYNK